MDKIYKLLRKIKPKEAGLLAVAIEKIVNNDVIGLNIKKLKEHNDIFRVRVGNYRIIYRKTNTSTFIIEISKRDENTYKNY